MSYNPIQIEATTLPDAWFQAVYKCIEVGREFKIDQGSYEGDKRLEFDYITIDIKHPECRPLLPEIPSQYNIPDPVPEGMDYVNRYLPYLMSDEIEEGEDYTYGQRLCSEVLNQIDMVIWTYKNKGYRNNQMVLQVAQPNDILLVDPPCLRHIDTRIQDNKLHFIIYFRSWDLWGGFPANLAAIQLLKEYMADQIGVGYGSSIVSSKGLHLYSYVWELAEIIRGKTIEDFRREVKSE